MTAIDRSLASVREGCDGRLRREGDGAITTDFSVSARSSWVVQFGRSILFLSQRDAFGFADLIPVVIDHSLSALSDAKSDGAPNRPYRNVCGSGSGHKGRGPQIAVDAMSFSLYVNTKFATTHKQLDDERRDCAAAGARARAAVPAGAVRQSRGPAAGLAKQGDARCGGLARWRSPRVDAQSRRGGARWR